MFNYIIVLEEQILHSIKMKNKRKTNDFFLDNIILYEKLVNDIVSLNHLRNDMIIPLLKNKLSTTAKTWKIRLGSFQIVIYLVKI